MFMLPYTIFGGFILLSSGVNLPVTYMDRGDVCRRVDGVSWHCEMADSCPGITEAGEQTRPCGRDPVKPLVCCPPERSLKNRHSIANFFCEKYMDVCGGVVGVTPGPSNDNSYALLEIAGGLAATSASQPHMALIGFRPHKKWICGGSLISERFVLTAAHCIPPAGREGLIVRLGELDYSRTDEDTVPEDFSVSRVVVHPEYKRSSLYHDIALLELHREVTFTPWIRPICLHTQKTVPFKTATVSGWGRIGPVDPLSSTLLVADVNLVSKGDCRAVRGTNSKLTRGVSDESMICAGDLTGKRDTCQGDSGGPLYVRMSNRCLPTQIGITSFGGLCTRPNSPGVYTKVYHYLSWIESIVWANSSFAKDVGR